MVDNFNIKVIKLGGTSQNIIPYTNVKKILHSLIEQGYKVFIVVSALSGITDILSDFTNPQCKELIILRHIEFIKQLGFDENYTRNISQYIEFIIYYIFKNPFDTNERQIERISLGEHLSSIIFNEFINYSQIIHNIKSKIIMATDILSYNSDSKNLNNLIVNTDKIINDFSQNDVIITQGFVASDVYGKTTILMGRGSSDTSGAIFAKFLKAIEYQIWTDVSGVYNIDPRLTSTATKINHLNFEMAQEMAGMGAKILHPYCIKPCQKANIPIIIKNSFNLQEKNTIIDDNYSSTIGFLIQKYICIIKVKSINMWHGIGFAADIFNTFASNNLDIDIITTSPFEITATVKKDNNIQYIINAIKELEQKYSVEMFEDYSIVSVVANNIIHSNKLHNIHLISQKYDIQLESISSNNQSISFGLKHKPQEFLLELYFNSK